MTELEKLVAQRPLFPDGSWQAQAIDAQIKKLNHVAPDEIKPGNVALDVDGNLKFYNPRVGDGIRTNFQTVNGVTTPVGAGPLPGYANAVAGIEGSTQYAKQRSTVFTGVPGPGGKPMSGFGGDMFGGGSGGASPSQSPSPAVAPAAAPAAPGSTGTGPSRPAPNMGAQQTPVQGTPTSPRVITGQSQTEKLLTDQGAQAYNKITSENANNAQHRAILNEIWGLVQRGEFGPGRGGMARVKALASNIGIDMTGAQTDQDILRKLSSNLVMSQLGQGGTGTDAQMSTIQSIFPNGEMTNDAMKKVVPMLISQIDAREARAKVASSFLNGGGQMSQLQDHLAKFNAIADPGTISLGKAMHEASLNGTAKQHAAQVQAKYGNAWPAIRARVQQLEQMGAF
jgi:hypothetical protein